MLALRRLVTFLTIILIAPLSSSVFLALVISSPNFVSLGAGCSMTNLWISFSVFSSPSATPSPVSACIAPLMFPLLFFSHSNLCFLSCVIRLHLHLVSDIFHHEFPFLFVVQEFPSGPPSGYLHLSATSRTVLILPLFGFVSSAPVLRGVRSSICGVAHNLQWGLTLPIASRSLLHGRDRIIELLRGESPDSLRLRSQGRCSVCPAGCSFERLHLARRLPSERLSRRKSSAAHLFVFFSYRIR